MNLRCFWIIWRLWKARNLVVFQSKRIPADVTLTLALKDAEEMTLASSTENDGAQLHRPGGRGINERWKPPALDQIKCNYDCAFRHNLSTGNGWLFRDETGKFLNGGYAKGLITGSPFDGELQALLMAMKSAWSLGYKKIVMEGDNQVLPKLISGEQQNFAAYNWLRDIRHWSQRFESISFLWSPRKTNIPAHVLSQIAIRNNLNCHMYSNVPNMLTTSLRDDMGS